MFRKNSLMRLSGRILLLLGVCSIALPALAGNAMEDVSPQYKKSVDSVTSKKLMDAPGGKFRGDKPVTRYELAVTLDRFVLYVEGGKKPLHPTPRPKPVKVPSHAGGKVSRALTHLVANSFIPDDSILLKGTGKEVVTASQLQVVLSQVVIRLSDRSVPPQKD